MISKQDILERAREWQLRPEVVEKDYVLGWLLAAIAQLDETSEQWVFKGGTCVKKCFFETYRFSEDLDFSILPDGIYSEDELRDVLREVTALASELSGIEFAAEALSVRSRLDKLGRLTFEGKIGYRGPLAIPGWPRVLFDLTQHEPVVDEPVLRAILHPYPDDIPADTLVQTYSLEELVAEKTRALYERTRPRDLYDVVYIVGNDNNGIDLVHARDVFTEKCKAKEFEPPTADQIRQIVHAAEEIEGEWANMLAHQLPQLPPLHSMLERLPFVISWVEPAFVEPAPLPPTLAGTEAIVAPGSASLWRTGVPLETIRFAGANRLLVRFWYSGRPRTIEPYSLRRSSRGNLLLYGWEVESAQIKAFDVSKITNVSTTDLTFTPRYRIEFTSFGPVNTHIPVASGHTRHRTTRRYGRRRAYSGPIYVFTCTVCGREFRHRTNDGSLRRHKVESGSYYCSGRRGYLSRVE